ncbi:MAG: XdhC family protein [Candidatus Aminicenantes bacterium]|nr:XdhC family protein [Candidatus Aminicenantes bacterium]
MKNIYSQFLSKEEKQEFLTLATIIETKGSSPQVPGASAVFSPDGLLYGTVGGGLLEAKTQEATLGAIREKRSLLLSVNLTGEVTSEEEAICGGEAVVLIDTETEKHKDTFLSLEESLKSRIPGVLSTFIQPLAGEQVSIARHWTERTQIYGEHAERLGPLYQDELQKCMSTGKPKLLKSLRIKTGEAGISNLLFLEPLSPPSHLVIAGAGHIGRALAHLGSLLDFEVTVIDDRSEFANADNLPEADRIIVGDIGKTIRNLPISQDTYVVIVTRGHSRDADALKGCIDSDAAYIGMIGSAHKTKLMHDNFLKEGLATPPLWDRIHAPIGIAIQSKTVQEIAVSIAAELVLVRNQVQDRLRSE